ncbi:hypothetical protein F511_44909 [Dorcoceras hygrometricum]|uniref:Uncharacterized protein n=1 Tax=Dorcoceras hygrometricum TaxID=472368 RepID=A0A2Z7BEA6_9LAMI|nr:hypothetical protein F511_44909 [Dorcoceras hygrometricum]
MVQVKDSAVGLVFMESAAGLAMETSKVESAVRNQVKANLNQLEHTRWKISSVEEEDFRRKLLLTNLLAVAFISTVDESIESLYSRSYEESQAGAETMKKADGVLSVDDISSDVIIQQEATVIIR